MTGLETRALRARASRRARVVPALLASLMVFTGHAQAQSCSVGETAINFGFTGGEQTTTVPAGVTSVTVYLSGAQGTAGRSGAGTVGGSPNSPGGAGGLGGRIRGTLAVTPGQILSIWVAGQGSQSVNPGGIGFGADGMGGGSTDLRLGGNALANRVAVAGGGGGGGNAGWSSSNVIAGGNGGGGGGLAGSAGATVPGGPGPFGGGGGQVGTGGSGGAGCGSFPATTGSAADGAGGDSFNFSGSFSGAGFGGGGGSGFTFGGGGGGAGVGTTACQQNWNGGGGGGAGGSSGHTALTSVAITNNVQSGNGAALVCLAPPSNFSVGGTASGQTGPVDLRLTTTNPVVNAQTTVVAGATTFAFSGVPAGANWNVSVFSAPAGQQCTVTPSSGLALSADVTNLALNCVTVATTITPGTLPNGTFDTAYPETTIAASSSNGGTAPYFFAVSAGALPPGLTLSGAGLLSGTPTAAGAFNFTVRATSSNGFSGDQAYAVTIAKADQTITFGMQADQVFSPGGTFALNPLATASSGLTIDYQTATPGICSISGTTVTMLATGTCHIAATQAGDANYNSRVFAQGIDILPASQAITNFIATPSAPTYTPGGSFIVSATGGATANPVLFASTTASVCSVSGNTVAILSAGTCSLTANQAGDANYDAAPEITLDVAIGAAAQAITGFNATPVAPTYAPGGTFTVAATGGASGNAVLFASTSGAVCSVSGNTVTMLSAGTCALTADQAGNTNYAAAPQVALNVGIGAAAQVITNFLANPGAPTYAPNGTFDLAATGGPSTSPVIFASTTASVCTVNGNTVTMLSAGACALTANQAADANYTAAPQEALSVTIAAATQAITNFVANPTAPTYAPGSTFNVSATGGASTSPVLFASTTASVCTVSGNTVTMLSAGTCALTANQAADGNYTAAPQVSINVTIGTASQAITNFIATPSAPTYAPNGTFAVSATGGASTSPVVFASTAPAVCTVTGSTVRMLASGLCTLTANQAGDANYAAAPQVTANVAIGAVAPTLAWIGNRDMIVGEASFDLPNPTSSSTGAFTFTSSNPSVATISGRTVTVVGPGVTTLTATQAAAGSYLAGQVTATLTVSARPDPTRDPEVVGGLQAQVDASVRFAAAQQSNVRDRLRQLRSSDGNPSSNGMTLNVFGGAGASLSLPASQVAPDDRLSLPQGWGLWTAGAITAGERDARTGAVGFDFHSDGVTLGVDRSFGERAVFGLAGGFGWDDTDFGSTSRLDGEQRALSAYGLWRAGEHLYLEGILGTGRLEFDITRWSEVANTHGIARRDGDQNYGSLAIGYEFAGDKMTLTGYGRYDESETTLDAYRETGLGFYDLSYGKQTIDSRSLAFGVEGSHWMQGASIAFRPYWMIEFRESLQNQSDASINYVVLPVASDYLLGLRSYNDDAFVFGAGVDMELFSGWTLSLLYRREHSEGPVDSNTFGFRLTWRQQQAAPQVSSGVEAVVPSSMSGTGR